MEPRLWNPHKALGWNHDYETRVRLWFLLFWLWWCTSTVLHPLWMPMRVRARTARPTIFQNKGRNAGRPRWDSLNRKNSNISNSSKRVCKRQRKGKLFFFVRLFTWPKVKNVLICIRNLFWCLTMYFSIFLLMNN
jgi:hypothetical protein